MQVKLPLLQEATPAYMLHMQTPLPVLLQSKQSVTNVDLPLVQSRISFAAQYLPTSLHWTQSADLQYGLSVVHMAPTVQPLPSLLHFAVQHFGALADPFQQSTPNVGVPAL